MMQVIERNAVRLVVLDPVERVLLLHVRDLSNPEFGTAWELPGGGIEAGETFIQAAIRELREETGFEISPECIDVPRWRRRVSYVYRGTRWLQQEMVALVRPVDVPQIVQGSHRVGAEKEDVLNARWWPVQEIVTSEERFYPRSLPTLLVDFLRGESIEEPLERWD
jgi:8-oxo-dGTP pyrophosphatase MutT (NUDIX family)